MPESKREPLVVTERVRGHLALFAVQLCFGLFPIFGRFVFESGAFTPWALASWRMLFGGVVLFAFALALHGRGIWPGWKELPGLFVLSLLGVSVNQVLYLNGLERSTAVNAGVVMCLIPVFTFLLAALVRQERFSAVRALGVLVSLGGALLWYLGERPELVADYAFGNFLMAINPLCYSVYLVASRPFLRRIPTLVFMAWVFLFAALCTPAIAAGEDLVPAQAGASAWWALAYILVFPTAIGYLLNVYALRRLRASTTGIYVYLQPFFAGVAGTVLLGEEITPALLAAGFAIFAGIYLVARRPPG